MISTDRLLAVLIESADTLVEDFDLVDFLHQLTDNTALVSGAGSVGLMLGDETGKLQFMAASTQGARHLELFQLQNDEGPCLECYETHGVVVESDLNDARFRWPAFTDRALSLGIRSVHAFPMRVRERVIGALNVFGESALPLADDEVAMVQSLADIATIALLQEQALSEADVLTSQLQAALNSRIVIEQAKGAVAQALQMTPDDAFLLIRRYARSQRLRLTDLCRDLLDRRTAIDAIRR